MKLDFISTVILVFCLGVGITLLADAKGIFRPSNTEMVVADSN